MSGRLVIDEEYVDIITTGGVQKPRMGTGFPAQLIETSLEWENLALQKEISIDQIARTYNLSGANIVNVVQFACLKTAEEGSNEISRINLLEGIRKEYVKEGKMFA